MNLGIMERRTEGIKRQAQELIEQAYQRGYNKAEKDYYIKTEKDRESSYQLGIEVGRKEAWETARELYQYDSSSNIQLCQKIFDCNFNEMICNTTASEAIEKIREYEEQKQKEDNEIKVGDEVVRIDDNSKIGVVTRIVSDAMWIIFPDGLQICANNLRYWKKTGRIFTEIAEILKKLKDGELMNEAEVRLAIEEKHKTCKNCRFSPPSNIWPCVDCDMRCHDRWEDKIND